MAACSADSARFSSNPNSNPFASSPTYTGSVAAAPTGAVQSAPMGGSSTGGVPLAPIGQPVASASPAPYGTPAPYGAPAPYGTPVASAPYGAPTQLSAAPTYTPPAAPQAGYGGTQPLYGSQPQPLQAPVAAAPVRTPAPQVAAAGGSHVVAPGETLSSIARNYGLTRTELANANGIDFNTMVRIGQKLTIPGSAGGAVIAAAPKPAIATPVAPKPTPVVATAPATPAVAPVAQATAAPKPQTIAAVKPSETPDEIRTAAAGPQFRWPVRGRVISGFGPKPGGQQNEGINISVPEGTSVKAAEDGVVAYAGSELKGYGNLVLIKHADGWVTAYANNSALDVKKGDTVKRGQVIAKAGQTGNVTSPQLHFEIRKGSQPVDPSQYLAGL
ncbi:M23 family metallopeptidase [Ancylobacter sp. FA202]|uniref:M23 family metallopeptidase n=1 Tax=Ancylobacter sp. FA202 TaxID=1111106 RepID=UPI00036022B6|nr:M23 family metallopeptidase [Ancylobacter sp. FA202]